MLKYFIRLFFFFKPFLGLLLLGSPKRNVHNTQNPTLVPIPQTRKLTSVIGLLYCCEIKIHPGKNIYILLQPKASITMYGLSINHYFTRPIFLHLIHPESDYFYHICLSMSNLLLYFYICPFFTTSDLRTVSFY